MVAYAPTKKAAEGHKTKYKATLNSTLASVPPQEYVFVLTDANARTGKRSVEGREADSGVLGTYGGDVLNKNGKLLLGFAENSKLALLHTFGCTPKRAVLRRESTKETLRTTGLRRLISEPSLRWQVGSATIIALPSNPDDYRTTIGSDMTDVKLSTATDLTPRFKRPRGTQGWYAGLGVESEMNEA